MRPLSRYLLLGCGWLALALGAIGVVLPLVPTVPFVLLASACFMRGSDRMHAWLVRHPLFGRHLRDYLSGRGIAAPTKGVALATVWASILTSVVFFVPLLVVDILLVTIAFGVSVFLLRQPSC